MQDWIWYSKIWTGKTEGISINGEALTNLRFADDVLIVAENGIEIERSLNELHEESQKLGMRINMKKTKVMFNDYAQKAVIHLGIDEVEPVESYVYLGQLVNMKSDKSDEIKRRIIAGWRAFGQNRDILQGNMPMRLKRKVYIEIYQCD